MIYIYICTSSYCMYMYMHMLLQPFTKTFSSGLRFFGEPAKDKKCRCRNEKTSTKQANGKM